MISNWRQASCWCYSADYYAISQFCQQLKNIKNPKIQGMNKEASCKEFLNFLIFDFLQTHLPFAVVGSVDDVKIGNKMVKARLYPWGSVQGECAELT